MICMYQALYRKYRPKTFDEVTGQQTIITTLKNAINNNKLSHAYLFSGPRGTGKTSVAKILAKTINCSNLVDLTPCNLCDSCIQIDQKQSTDIIEIDAASNNGVDEIRELKSKVNLVPSTSKYKVYIIDEVHMLTVGAFNALLKTLEEPPQHILFVLATTESHKIPATILSRCQRFDFKKISIEQIVERLRYICDCESVKIEDAALFEIARISDGGMRDSISLLDQAISYSDQVVTVKDIHDINGTVSQYELEGFFDLIVQKNLISLLNIIDEYDKSGKNLVKLMDEMITFLRNSLIYMSAPGYFENGMDITCYQNFCSNVSQEQMFLYIDLYNQVYSDMKKSGNPKLLFELLLIKLTQNDNNFSKCDNNDLSNATCGYDDDQKVNISGGKDQTKIVKQEIDDNYDKAIDTNRLYADSVLKKIGELRDRRICNTLAHFNKKTLNEVQDSLNDICGLILDPEYNHVASLMMDAKLKAASDEYLVFVLPNENISNLFNEQLLIIEKMFKQTYNKDYKIISTFEDEWNIIKDDFNSKKRKFVYQEETESLDHFFQLVELENSDDVSKNVVDELFGNIVEYN